MVTLIVGPGAEVGGPHSMINCILVRQDQRLRIAAHDGTYQSFTVEFAGWQLHSQADSAHYAESATGQDRRTFAVTARWAEAVLRAAGR